MSIVQALAAPTGFGTAASTAIAVKLFERTRDRLTSALRMRALDAAADSLESLTAPCQCWRPELGMAATAVRDNPPLAALQFALLAPPEGELCVTVNSPGHLYLDGHAWTVQGELRLRCEGHRLYLAGGPARASFLHYGGCWRPDRVENDRVPAILSLPWARPRYLLDLRSRAQAGAFPDPRIAAETARTREPETTDSAQHVASALDRIGAHAPEHAKWVSSVIDCIAFTEVLDGGISNPALPGLVAVSPVLAPDECAELLVCAAAQQKLHQLALAAPLTTATEEVHYMSSRRSYTTARKMLAAAHEHAAAITLLERLRALHRDEALLEKRLSLRRLMFEAECIPVLDRSRALSEAGKALWDRLKDVASPGPRPTESATPQVPVAGLATLKEQ